MNIKPVIVGFGLLVLILGAYKSHSYAPLFFLLEFPDHADFSAAFVGEFDDEDLMEPIRLELVTMEGKPAFYTSHLRTTVCDDEVCEIMHIHLFWDLTGVYAGFDTVAGHPLTKFDHEPFTSEDYLKLHQLLMNDGSILKFKAKEELIDKEKVSASDVVDGTTGATALEIREEIVEGALYTSYTLWHLAYSGAIKKKLNQHTEEVYDDELKSHFLQSSRSSYQVFAVERFLKEDFIEYQPDLLEAIKEGIPLLRKQILNKLPASLWEHEGMQTELCNRFYLMDVNSKTLLLSGLNKSTIIHSKSLQLLSQHIYMMNKNQLAVFLTILAKQEQLAPIVLANLKKAVEDQHFEFGYLIEDRLGKLPEY